MAEEISPLENHGWWMERLLKDAKANQPEALRLAHWLERDGANCQAHIDAAAELRRLHVRNQELLEALDEIAINTHDDTAERVARAAIAKAEGA